MRVNANSEKCVNRMRVCDECVEMMPMTVTMDLGMQCIDPRLNEDVELKIWEKFG